MRITVSGAARMAYASALLAIVGWFLVDFPIYRFVLAVGFLFYAACLWRWPRLWLVVLPALLPLLDLAPLSGRFFFDEFDALVVLTCAILSLRATQAGPVAPLSREMKWVLALLAASYFASTLIRLSPPAEITVDSFSNYTSPYNSLRVAKGFVFALLLVRPLREAMVRPWDARLLLGKGFIIGLAGVALVSLFERWLFPGIFSWITEYRTTASFSSMHTGDGPIDVWLAMTIPFLGLLLIDARRWRLMPLTLAIGLISAYALLVTESRGPVVALVVAYAVGLFALSAASTARRRAAGVLLLCLSTVLFVALIALPVLAQSSLGQRFGQSRQDAMVRFHHWRNVLALRDSTLLTQIFGMGLGSYPAIHGERSTVEPRAARYRFVSDEHEHYLTLWSGQNLYMGQSIETVQNSTYSFSAVVRTSEPRASFNVAWCEVWMLYSANCAGSTVALQASPARWQKLTRTIHTNDVGSGRAFAGLQFERPTRLTFFVTDAAASGVDIGEVSVKDARGRELLRNTDFSRGADFWFWTVDTDLPWHTLNMAVDILFEQGWLGIAAVGSLLWLTFVRLSRQVVGGDRLGAVFLASLAAFVVNTITISTFDQPRLVLAFLLIAFASLLSDRDAAAASAKQSN